MKLDRYKNESQYSEAKREEKKNVGLPEEFEEETIRPGGIRQVVATPMSDRQDGSDPDNEDFLKAQEEKYTNKYISSEDIPGIISEADLDNDLISEEVLQDSAIDKYNKEHENQYKLEDSRVTRPFKPEEKVSLKYGFNGKGIDPIVTQRKNLLEEEVDEKK